MSPRECNPSSCGACIDAFKRDQQWAITQSTAIDLAAGLPGYSCYMKMATSAGNSLGWSWPGLGGAVAGGSSIVIPEPLQGPTVNFENDAVGKTAEFVLVLDASCSMDWAVTGDNVEACNNGIDDDGDGFEDEFDKQGCKKRRLVFMREAAESVVVNAAGKGIRLGIVSFSDMALREIPPLIVDSSSLPAMMLSIQGIKPRFSTDIGKAIDFAVSELTERDMGALLLISDGEHNGSRDPIDASEDAKADGVRVYTIGTGFTWHDQRELKEIAHRSSVSVDGSADATGLVPAFIRQYTNWRGGVLLVPNLHYVLDGNATGQVEVISGPGGWIDHAAPSNNQDYGPQGVRVDSVQPVASVRFAVDVPADTTRLMLTTANDHVTHDVPQALEVRLTEPTGLTFSSLSPGGPLAVDLSTGFMNLELAGPIAGRWLVEVRTSDPLWPLQSGSVVVHADANSGYAMAASSEVAPSSDIEVVASPRQKGLVTSVAEASYRLDDGSLSGIHGQLGGAGPTSPYHAVVQAPASVGPYTVYTTIVTSTHSVTGIGEPLFAIRGIPSSTVAGSAATYGAQRTIMVTDGMTPIPTGPFGMRQEPLE